MFFVRPFAAMSFVHSHNRHRPLKLIFPQPVSNLSILLGSMSLSALNFLTDMSCPFYASSNCSFFMQSHTVSAISFLHIVYCGCTKCSSPKYKRWISFFTARAWGCQNFANLSHANIYFIYPWALLLPHVNTYLL